MLKETSIQIRKQIDENISEYLKLLLRGLDDNKGLIISHGYQAMKDSIERESLSGVETLLNYGFDINYKDENCNTILMLSINKFYTTDNKSKIWEIILLLLSTGANPNIQNIDGDTPLILSIESYDHVAVFDNLESQTTIYNSNNIQIISLLLNCGANPNLCNKDTCTPFEIAFFSLNFSIMRLLLCYGAHPTVNLAYDETTPPPLLIKEQNKINKQYKNILIILIP